MKQVGFRVPDSSIDETTFKALHYNDWFVNNVTMDDVIAIDDIVRFNAYFKFWENLMDDQKFKAKQDTYWKIRKLYYQWITRGMYNCVAVMNDPDPRISNLAKAWGEIHLDFTPTIQI